MKIFSPLLLFLLLPFLEILLVLYVSDIVGGLNAFILVVTTSAFGVMFINISKERTLKDFLVPNNSKRFDSSLNFLIGGIFLIIPGFATDILGLYFLLTYRKIRSGKFLFRSFDHTNYSNVKRTRANTIDGEYKVEEKENEKPLK